MPRAPRHCPGAKGTCDNLIGAGETYCLEHTEPWATSTWNKPPGWDTTRKRVLRAHNNICHVCGHPGATEVDHVRNQARNGSDDPHNLRPIHPTCHKRKTAHDRLAP